MRTTGTSLVDCNLLAPKTYLLRNQPRKQNMHATRPDHCLVRRPQPVAIEERKRLKQELFHHEFDLLIHVAGNGERSNANKRVAGKCIGNMTTYGKSRAL